MIDIPAQPGSYLLLLALDAPARLRVGRLGEFDFPAGYYLYSGSAFGPGGLSARVRRHLEGAAGCHWHIDYLRRLARVEHVCWVVGQRRECDWAQMLFRLGGRAAIPGFGSSDCRSGCAAHLVFFADAAEARDAFQAVIHSADHALRTSS